MSVFDGVGKKLEDMGPIGSAAWYVAWDRLRLEVQSMHVSKYALEPDELADKMYDRLGDEWRDETKAIWSGDKPCPLGGYREGYPPNYPEPDADWNEIVLKLMEDEQ